MNKLWANLAACQKTELPDLKRFVASPYYNRQQELSLFLDILLPYWPAFSDNMPDRTAIYAKIFPDVAFDEKHYRYLSSALSKLVERFWTVRKCEEHERIRAIDLLDSASERGAHKTFRQVKRLLEKESDRSSAPPDSHYFLEQMHWSEVQQKHFERSRERRYDDSIQRQNDHLDRYYFLEKMRLSCAMLDRQTIVAGDYNSGASDALIHSLKEQRFFEEPAIEMYYHVWCALRHEAEEMHFSALLQQIRRETRAIAMSDRQNIYRVAINYCARKIRQGQEAYVLTALELYKAGLEEKVFLQEGFLSPWTFTNVVKLSMRLQQYDWGESFIRDYAAELPPGFRENALHYNLAELFYYTRRSGEALLHLNQVAFSDLNYYLGARVLLAKIYYEENAEEALLSLIAAFTIFLKRNRTISLDLKQTYLNFCEILFQLVRRHPKKINFLGETIQNTALLTDRSWLLQQWERLTKTSAGRSFTSSSGIK